MKIFAATNNAHKLVELRTIFAVHEIVSPADFGIETEPEENGTSFVENALIKAKAFYAVLCDMHIPLPVLSDDSGLCVDALGGKPGIFSARYSGSKPKGTVLTQDEKNRMLIAEIPADAPRNAHFACALVLYFGGDRLCCVQETLCGKIVQSENEVQGASGFGYDPIFVPDFLPSAKTGALCANTTGCTLAQLSEAEKNEISHRGKACKTLLRLQDL
ncbi:MAG: RdgB/HAM1 family non-canonical purine NTP pyrophosphatase [Treponemataceae bacterium]|nr:MAG: RdgB/HAM1 family non-canonical purine NTP pyrophosphatase [Treponemataceae bacterium]